MLHTGEALTRQLVALSALQPLHARVESLDLCLLEAGTTGGLVTEEDRVQARREDTCDDTTLSTHLRLFSSSAKAGSQSNPGPWRVGRTAWPAGLRSSKRKVFTQLLIIDY